MDETKLTRTKRAWAAAGKFLTGRTGADRLPPGQHLVTDWPVLDLGITPVVEKERFRLQVTGFVETPLSLDRVPVETPLSLDWDAVEALAQTEARSDIHCVTSWSRYDNDWRGIGTRDLLAGAGVMEIAGHVLLHGADGYVTNLPLADFTAPGAMLATQWQGAPLTRDHGGPLRAVIPHLYFWKSAKWLTKIEVIGTDQAGFWERNGYHMRGDPWAEERYG